LQIALGFECFGQTWQIKLQQTRVKQLIVHTFVDASCEVIDVVLRHFRLGDFFAPNLFGNRVHQ